jgi:biotin carboxyl carrier protein
LEYKVRIGNEEFQFTITGSGRSLRVRREGKALPVDFREVGPGTYSLLIGKEAHLVTTQRNSGGITIRVDGRTFPARVGRVGAAGVDDGDGGIRGAEKEIRSVMPGIVTRILVSPGDPVEPGTPLLVLEAMKMENEVRSHRGGTVEKVHVREGQPVDSGNLLITMGAPRQ